ncbi:hypothetical protein [Litoribacter populi]|uniref:hypothetical protein n=1 Tax=Litoribacter populi TaxID=2598460 RepID=UPI00163DA6A5|nr:hypothetical protein [Litoribacter populi]
MIIISESGDSQLRVPSLKTWHNLPLSLGLLLGAGITVGKVTLPLFKFFLIEKNMIRNSILIIVLILCQCTSDKYSEYREGETWVRIEGDLPDKEHLAGIPFGIKKFYSTRKPFLVDGHIIVSDKAMSPPLHVIDLKNRKWAYGLGVEGYGPGEISYIWTSITAPPPESFGHIILTMFFLNSR